MKKSFHNAIYTEEDMQGLKLRLQEAEDTIHAIREGAVDALVVKDHNNKQQIFTLKSADYAYRLIIESMSQGAVTISDDGIVLYCNKQFVVMIGKPLEQVVGSNIMSFIHDDDAGLMAVILKQSSANTRGSERTVRLKSKKPLDVMISARKLPYLGESAYMCLVITDMTERKQVETAKDEFISLASHQLRTPATSVKQYIGMLLDEFAGKLTPDQRMLAKTAYDSNERQLAIINSILKTAKIDFGAYEMKTQSQDMKLLIDETINAFEPMLTTKNQTLEFTCENNVVAIIEPIEISLVIANLIENASKYSHNGNKIKVKLFTKKKYVYIAVSDSGVGILTKNHIKVFEKFSRINNTLSDSVSGSGLGLYWVKRIAELHGGAITLKSKLNVGSTFTLKLPL